MDVYTTQGAELMENLRNYCRDNNAEAFAVVFSDTQIELKENVDGGLSINMLFLDNDKGDTISIYLHRCDDNFPMFYHRMMHVMSEAFRSVNKKE